MQSVAELSGVRTALLLRAVEDIKQDEATFTTKLTVRQRRVTRVSLPFAIPPMPHDVHGKHVVKIVSYLRYCVSPYHI
jgi:hypothetical protein